MKYTCKKCGAELPEDMTKECPTCLLNRKARPRWVTVGAFFIISSALEGPDALVFPKERKP